MKYKAVSHIHSDISYDGRVLLSEIAEILQRNQIDIAFITEHSDFLSQKDVRLLVDECERLSSDSLLLVPGLEVPSTDGHVLVIGVDREIQRLDPVSVIEQYSQRGFIVFPHPHRSSFHMSHTLFNSLDAVEVWNSHYDGKRYPRMKSLGYFYKLYSRDDSIKVFAGLDFHRKSHWGGPSIHIEADELSKSVVIRALKKGEYFIKGGGITISSKGGIEGISTLKLSLVSTLSVGITSFFKGLSALLHFLHIRPPKRLKEWLRRAI